MQQLSDLKHTASLLPSLRARLQRLLRSRLSEYHVLKVGDRFSALIKQSSSGSESINAVNLRRRVGFEKSRRGQAWLALVKLRRLVASPHAIERALHEALVAVLKLSRACEAASEIPMARGAMRMDVVVSWESPEKIAGRAEILELKRASCAVLAYQGKRNQRVTRRVTLGLKQASRYGNHVDTDHAAASKIAHDYGLEVSRAARRLVIGRRVPTAEGYRLLNAEAQATDPRLQISTWDGLVAELADLIG